MTIDSHVFFGDYLYGQGSNEQDILDMMRENDVDRCVLIAAKPKDYDFVKANTAVYEAVKKYPDKFVGLCRVDPWQREKAVAELERCYDLGFRGICLNPFEETFQANNEIVFPIMQFAQEHGLPVVIETGYWLMSHPMQVGDLARRYPDVTVIMTNGGEMDLSGYTRSDVDEMMTLYPNLMLGTTGQCSRERIYLHDKIFGANRVIYESHFPLYDPRLEIYRIRKTDLSDRSKQLTLGENAQRLFW